MNIPLNTAMAMLFGASALAMATAQPVPSRSSVPPVAPAGAGNPPDSPERKRRVYH